MTPANEERANREHKHRPKPPRHTSTLNSEKIKYGVPGTVDTLPNSEKIKYGVPELCPRNCCKRLTIHSNALDYARKRVGVSDRRAQKDSQFEGTGAGTVARRRHAPTRFKSNCPELAGAKWLVPSTCTREDPHTFSGKPSPIPFFVETLGLFIEGRSGLQASLSWKTRLSTHSSRSASRLAKLVGQLQREVLGLRQEVGGPNCGARMPNCGNRWDIGRPCTLGPCIGPSTSKPRSNSFAGRTTSSKINSSVEK